MIDLHANLIAETGRRNNLLIPPNSLRWVPSDYRVGTVQLQQNVYVVLSNDDLMVKAVFVPNHMFRLNPDTFILVPLYNGGAQSFYVQHEMTIATLLIYPGMTEWQVSSSPTYGSYS